MAVDSPIDIYISNAPEYAKPILLHLLELIYTACPDVTETIKWGVPHFEYKGVICGMAAFKQHCAFTFWKAPLMKDPHGILDINREKGMGHLGRITCLQDLPSDDIIMNYIRQAVALNENNIQLPKKNARNTTRELAIPDYITEALQTNKKALEVFEKFSYSHKKEYIEWITEAKTEATRNKRTDTMLEWLEEGKSRHWKYQKK